jgi:hypothetical protein
MTKLQFCDKKYIEGTALTVLDSEEVGRKLGFKYLEQTSLRQSFLSCVKHFYPEHNPEELCRIKGIQVLEKPEESIAIHKTCETMGYGLVATKTIPQNTVVLEYLGKNLGFSPTIKDDAYVCSLAIGEEHPINAPWVSAKDEGNLARFACYLPDINPFKDYRIQTSNLNFEIIPGSDYRHGFLITKTDINPHDELGWDYGGHYNLGDKTVYYNLDTGKFIRTKGIASKPKHDSLELGKSPAHSDEEPIKFDADKAFMLKNDVVTFDALGTALLTGAALIEYAPVVNYCSNEIIAPLLPFGSSIISNDTIAFPNSNAFWVTSYFSLSFFGYLFITQHNYKKSVAYSVVDTVRYGIRLQISDMYQEAVETRVCNKLTVDDKSEHNLLQNCFNEVALNSVVNFAFSTPLLTKAGVAFSTSSTAILSAIACASSNNKITSPNSSFSGKIIPYIVDTAVISMIYKANFCTSLHIQEINIIQKTAFLMSVLAATDQIVKSVVEIIPNEFFEYIDSFLGFEEDSNQNGNVER